TLRAGTGNISQATNSDFLALTSTPLLLIANTGIGIAGSGNFITTGLTDVAARTATGGLSFKNNTAGNINIKSLSGSDLAGGVTSANGLSATTSGSISLWNATTGSVTVSAPVSAVTGSASLNADGDLTVNAAVSSTNNSVVLKADQNR